MKRIIPCLMVLAVALLMFGCGNGSTNNDKLTDDTVLNDTGTSILGCSYSKKASTANGTHYLLSISFNDAETNIKNALGSSFTFPCENQQNIAFEDPDPEWVIIEVIPGWDQVRLVEKKDGNISGKGWN